jgi:hypothetical protein
MAVRRSQSEPLAPAERRGALRHPVQVEGALERDGAPGRPVLITDISERGCQIVRLPELVGGEAIRLSFGGFAPFHATVVWTSAEAAGLRFDYPAHAALIGQIVAAAKGRKRNKRLLAPELVRRQEREQLWHLRLLVTYQVEAQGGPAIPAMLSDLSTDGCRLVAAVTPLPDASLLITVPGRQPIEGRVRWCVANAVGVAFAEPLPSTSVAAIAEQARGAPPQQG